LTHRFKGQTKKIDEGTAVASRPSGSIPRDPFIAIINKIEMNQERIFLQRSLVNKVNKVFNKLIVRT
jgi:hypothetical protein